MPGGIVRATVNLTGLPPNSTHGFHIHEKGDLSAPDLASAGSHFNPRGHQHGGPSSPMSHAGDLGNVTSDASGNVSTEMTVNGVTVDQGTTGIVGRSVILHAQADDLKTDPSGNSGARIAGGVIEAKQ
jgi:Cu-Zn family superoxide dismutase